MGGGGNVAKSSILGARGVGLMRGGLGAVAIEEEGGVPMKGVLYDEEDEEDEVANGLPPLVVAAATGAGYGGGGAGAGYGGGSGGGCAAAPTCVACSI